MIHLQDIFPYSAVNYPLTTMNGRDLYESGIITNLPQLLLKEDMTDQDRKDFVDIVSRLDKQIQQVGIDLTVAKIEQEVFTAADGEDIELVVGFEKKYLRPLRECATFMHDEYGICWRLKPGSYHITFNEGCQIPADTWLEIRHRSTMLRGSCLLVSAVFDPGFETEQMGTVFHVLNGSVIIQKDARLGQILAHSVNPVQDGDLYGNESKGSSYQNDKQRKA